jgi:dTDP-4-amino-4,6-dideoxygalactose transaminase
VVPFNVPYTTGREAGYIAEAVAAGHLSGNGAFTRRCERWLEDGIGSARAMLTPSCTAALEMAAILLDVGPGDEIVMPSFTFVSTANAFALRGASPVFVDVRPDTLTIDVDLVRSACTDRTRTIVPVHYAGVGCDMDELCALADSENVALVEDAAQGILATESGRPLGSRAALAALSFHETKNVMCGEGGALLVNDERFIERAEVVQEKGTNRRRFFRGQVDRYTWVDVGSSYLLSELSAAFLWAQLEDAERITARRLEIWDSYHAAFAPLEAGERLRRPVVPASRTHNAHMYYVLLPSERARDRFIADLAEAGVHSVFHYVPLHNSAAGSHLGRAVGSMRVTDDASRRLARLPLWAGMREPDVEQVVDAVTNAAQTA